jgi:N-acetylmuramic acid 6-phosphate etherase
MAAEFKRKPPQNRVLQTTTSRLPSHSPFVLPKATIAPLAPVNPVISNEITIVSSHLPATEGRNAASVSIDSLSPLEIVALMNAEDSLVAAAVAKESSQIAAAIAAVSERLRQGGRLIYAGAGTSGRLGVLDASECPPTFSVHRGLIIGLIAGGPQALTTAVEGAEDNRAAGATDLAALQITSLDAVMGIAASGRTPYVLGALELARKTGCLTLGLACSPASPIQAAVDIMVAPITGPEILTGSTRLKAGTATKMVLNMLTTGVMIRLGKTYGNLMVDLNASNEKLRDRAQRIVADITGLAQPDAAAALEACHGEVKTAIVSVLRQLSPENSRKALSEAGGQLRKALEAQE